ncbi:MAG: dihydroneopterin aldolase [Paludibacteraceae bacterium]|nr:dihydroneopterin aldolase [Paludibacteraceae bacterium]MBN2787654.1 dihydroneopterin aldolase [Paludibacteraceae bacterium]
MSKIKLEKMRFYAYHGCFAEEQLVGTNFELTIAVELDTHIACKTDAIEDALNYQELYQTIKAEMQLNSKLIENVGQRIINKLFVRFAQIEGIELELSKLNPPLGGQIERVSILLSEQRAKKKD